MRRFALFVLWLVILTLLGVALWQLSRAEGVAWRLDALRARLKYALHPPEEVIFVPSGQGNPTPSFTPTPQSHAHTHSGSAHPPRS